MADPPPNGGNPPSNDRPASGWTAIGRVSGRRRASCRHRGLSRTRPSCRPPATPARARVDTDREVPDLPYVLRPRGLRAGFTALLSALAVFVVPAAAQAACGSTPTTKAFQAFGDSADYSLAPDGAFEAGGGGWSLNRARWWPRQRVVRAVHAPATPGRSRSPPRHRRSRRPCASTSRARRSASSRSARAARWGSLDRQAALEGRVAADTNETTVGLVASGTAWRPRRR